MNVGNPKRNTRRISLVRSLRARFTILLVLVVTLVMVVAGVRSYARTQANYYKDLSTQIAQTQQRLEANLQQSLWAYDEQQIRSAVEAERYNEALLGIQVLNPQGVNRYSLSRIDRKWVNGVAMPAADQIQRMQLTYTEDGITRKLGELVLYVSERPIVEKMQIELNNILWQLLLINLAVIAAIYILMHAVVLKPLHDVKQALVALDAGDADLSLQLPDNGITEFDELTHSFNRFIVKLRGVMGAPINHVQDAIARVAQGELGSTLDSESFGRESIMGRLSVMQDNLRAYQSNEKIHAQDLQEALHAAEAASRAKGDFLANMSHEIRTPMNAIIGLSALALKHEMPPRILDYLHKIKQSGEHLLGIINDILDFSKIESGKLEIEAVPFEIDSVFQNVVNLTSEKVEAKNLELLCTVSPEVPKILIGDPLRIGQILINLTSNAIKFTDQGEIRLSVSVELAHNEQVQLIFKVTDTGIGLTEEQIGRLFRSFVQADTSTTRKYGGTGLGLAISKSMAEAMHGKIGVESEVGKGSTFWFSAQLGIGSEEKSFPRPIVDLQGLRVLVVDDNQAAALVLSDMLNQLGFRADHVDSGAQAIEHIKSANAATTPFAFVLMDWLMPRMNGLETIRVIQSMHATEAPIMLMVTAHRRQELIKEAEELGIHYVLSKPVRASMLVDSMMHAMGHAMPVAQVRLGDVKERDQEALLARIAGARILLVEDNEINQLVACELLRGAGFEVDVAENGELAVNCVDDRFNQQLPYDLVLMDMQMPVMDGVTAARLIRDNHSAERLPIVAMTANAMKADRDRCLAAGMNGYVTKPINPAELWRSMLQSIKMREGLGEPAATAPVLPEEQMATDDVEDVLVPLRSIAGLEVHLGLLRTNNNPKFYLSLLKRFVGAQADATERIRVSLAQGDPATAELLAHTLKGVAGNLGATVLQTSAELLETALRNAVPDSETMPLLQRTAEHLAQLTLALQNVPGLWSEKVVQTDGPQSDAQRQAAQVLLAELSNLLLDNDAAALELWEANAVALRPLLTHATEIESDIQNFAFEEALALIQASVASESSTAP